MVIQRCKSWISCFWCLGLKVHSERSLLIYLYTKHLTKINCLSNFFTSRYEIILFNKIFDNIPVTTITILQGILSVQGKGQRSGDIFLYFTEMMSLKSRLRKERTWLMIQTWIVKIQTVIEADMVRRRWEMSTRMVWFM